MWRQLARYIDPTYKWERKPRKKISTSMYTHYIPCVVRSDVTGQMRSHCVSVPRRAGCSPYRNNNKLQAVQCSYVKKVGKKEESNGTFAAL